MTRFPPSQSIGQGKSGRHERRRSRAKGARVERAIIHALQADGFAAAHCPVRFAGDVVVPVRGRDLTVEVKADVACR